MTFLALQSALWCHFHLYNMDCSFVQNDLSSVVVQMVDVVLQVEVWKLLKLVSLKHSEEYQRDVDFRELVQIPDDALYVRHLLQ